MNRTMDKARLEQAAVWQRKADDAARQLRTETDPHRAYLLELGVKQWGAQAAQLRGLSPRERRIVGTAVLCAAASTLFVGSAAHIGGLSPELALVGVGGPVAIAGLMWNIVIPPRMVRDVDTRTAWRPDPERVDAEVSAR